MTKQEVKEIAITAPITGFTPAAGIIVDTDTILQALQKLQANAQPTNTAINLLNYYNFI